MRTFTCDIETIKGCFLLCAYVPEQDVWHDFFINESQNDLYPMIKFLDDHKDHYMVTYNGLSFDGQVIEYIWRTHEKWFDKSGKEICELIYKKAQDVIDDTNHGLFPPYRESELTFKQLDLFRINHYDNKNRMVSLKRLEYELDLENIEEMAVSHTKESFTEQELAELKHYCRNDVHATYEFYLVTTGKTEHPLYKGNDQVQLRLDIQEEFGIECLNYSDSKIGDEIIKKYYCEERGISYKDLPRKGFFRKEVKLKHCVADYVKFQTKELQAFLKEIKDTTLKQNDDFKKAIKFHGNTYSFMKGGIHSENKPEIFEADDEYMIVDWDVSSMYPATIINNERYPYHLGKEFLSGYKKMFEKRLTLKPLAKKDRKIAGIVGALKLSVNSVYGKSSDMQSWIYDRQLTMFTTINGELSLLMLIEAYELNGLHIISANTDGITARIRRSDETKMFQINQWWQEVTKYELERTDYQKLIFSTVNDYIAVKTDGSIKKKGDFLTEFELHKNKSFKIIPLALEAYFLHEKNPEEFVHNHKNIYDFCGRAKASRDFHYEGLNKETNEITMYNKLIRYFVSNNGLKLLKMKNPECQTNAAEMSEVHAGEWLCTVCNHLTEKDTYHFDNINYTFYLEKINEMINKINIGKKVKKKFVDPNQISMF